ncbi:LysR family transcriptional regulator [Kribbella swartbergensis]
MTIERVSASADHESEDLPALDPPAGAAAGLAPTEDAASVEGASLGVASTFLAPRLALLSALAQYGHLSAAAASLGIAQSTASRWLQSLNARVGVDLTRRVHGQIQLTAAGHTMAEAVEFGQSLLRLGVARAQVRSRPHDGQVRFGYLRSLATSKAPYLLRRFSDAFPRVRFVLHEANHEELTQRLRRGDIDIALTTVDQPDTVFVEYPLLREPLVLVVPEAHRWAKRDSVRVHECRDVTMVGLVNGTALRRSVDELLLRARVRPRYTFVTAEIAVLRGLVAAGMGVAVLPGSHDAPTPGSAEIALVPRTYRRVGLVVAAHRPLEPAAEAFLQASAALKL